MIVHLLLGAVLAAPADSLERLSAGRVTVESFASDRRLARSLLAAAARDSFPGLPRSRRPVLIQIAPDLRRFREWIGPAAPEWGSAVAFPAASRIVMQGSRAGSDAGDPVVVLRHELAHLALHEWLGDLPPRWFDEGYASYAAGEWSREQVLGTNVALVTAGLPTLAGLDSAFHGGSARAGAAYALAHQAVAELAALDETRGLVLFFDYWRQSGSIDRAIRSAYGMTLVGFEAHWRARVRRRFGVLALFTDVGLAAAVLLAITLPLWLARRRRNRRRLQLMVEADRAADERARMLEALLGASPEVGRGGEEKREGADR